jgi:hypothetical protein
VPVPVTFTVFTVRRSRNQSASDIITKWQAIAVDWRRTRPWRSRGAPAGHCPCSVACEREQLVANWSSTRRLSHARRRTEMREVWEGGKEK